MAECPGVYRLSQMRDGAMARIRVPGGALTSAQIQVVANIARDLGNGLIDLTNRANLQIRGLPETQSASIADRLFGADLLSPNPDADRLRNITASPLAGFDETEIIDVRPYIADLDQIVCASTAIVNRSVKFAFVLDGGGRGGLGTVGHDIGFFATRASGEPVFEISLAGTRTGRAIATTDLPTFARSALELVETEKATRVRDLLQNRTAKEVLQTICNDAGIDNGSVTGDAAGAPIPLGFGSTWLALGVPLGRLMADQMIALAEMSQRGNGTIRLTPWQSVVLPCAPERLAEEAACAGFDTLEDAIRIVACAGATGCVRTVADTKADGLRLRTHLADLSNSNAAPCTIHLSGCARGCAMPGESDILALAQPESANYALYAGSRPATAHATAPDKSDVSPTELPDALHELIG